MEKIFQLLPPIFQNTLISIYNIKEYKKRCGGRYGDYKSLFYANRSLSLQQLQAIQKKRFVEFVERARLQSSFYKNLLKEKDISFDTIDSLPIVSKELLRKNIKQVYTVSKKNGIKFKTGGTTGKSLEVLYTPDNMQERFALLDDFRSRLGYQLGKKTAWFSGKNLLVERDIRRNIFWKTDFWYKVRYYSTFHIKKEYLGYYIENLIEFKPEFFVGFPSSILELAKYGLKEGIVFPENTVKAIFPTAETVTSEMRADIEKFFKAPMYDQYSSSEGAPFIFECKNKNLHLELQSGVFEVLDRDNRPAKLGRLIVTSFTTEGTPLIRYDIGDSIELSDENCSCGNHNPLVKQILGRIDDYVYSPQNGKINLGNVSNTLKDTQGIVKFQIIQNKLNAITIKLIIDSEIYNPKIEKIFIKNWRDRLGPEMEIKLEYVNQILNEASGKFRIVKNDIKNLVD